MPLYILDASAVVSLADTCDAVGHAWDEVADALTELAIAGDLTCPAIVIRECRRYGEDEPSTKWLRQASGHFANSEDPWEYLEEVLATCPTLIDQDETGENPQATVLAMARFQSQSRDDVIIVTDQWSDLPTRRALGSAAAAMGVSAITVQAFVDALDL